MKCLQTISASRVNRRFHDLGRAQVQIRRAEEGASAQSDAVLRCVGPRDAVIETSRADLTTGDRIRIRLAYPELLRPISAEAYVIDRAVSAAGPRLQCRLTRVGPGGARVLHHLGRAIAIDDGAPAPRPGWPVAASPPR